MAELIPTPIVDRNGRATTVHKKPSVAPKGSALKGIKPVLKQQQPADQVNIIKGKVLHAASLSLQLFSDDEQRQYELTSSKGEFEWRKSVEMTETELYSYLMVGADSQDAATLHGLGVSPDDERLVRYTPGRLGRYEGRFSYNIVSNRKVIARFQAAGISALEAEKALANKVHDIFLDKALDEHQLLELFTRKKINSPVSGSSVSPNDSVTYSFLHGRLPMSVVDLGYKELKGINREMVTMSDERFRKLTADPELLEAVIRKAAASPEKHTSVSLLHQLVERHGSVVLEMDDPYLCSVVSENRGSNDITGGIDSALYFDRVYTMLKESGRSYGSNGQYEWWGGYFTGGVSVKNTDLELLRQAGLTPQEAYEGLVVSRLHADQIIVAHEDNVPQSLANGAL